MFCGHNIWTEGVFVTELSGSAGISVWRTVWVICKLDDIQKSMASFSIERLCEAVKIVFHQLSELVQVRCIIASEADA
jgi:hypothetical protein